MHHLFTGALSYYELGALLTHLPPESAYRTARRDQYTDEQLAEMSDDSGNHGPWSKAEMLQAVLIDVLQNLCRIQMARGGQVIDPIPPVRRPGVVTVKREVSPQAVAYLERIREVNKQAREGA